MRFLRIVSAGGLLIFLWGCGSHMQSVLDPRSPAAREIAHLWWVMFGVYTAVFVLVIWLSLQAVFGKRGVRVPGGPIRFLVALGIVMPAVVLVFFLFYSLRVSVVLSPPEEGLTIEVTGHQWWWDVRYPEHAVVIANEIHIPAGERVRIQLRAHDVVHSFWVPNLHGKIDVMPDVETEIWIESDEPGVWRGQCAEFCGTQHALMAFEVVVHEPDDFDRWLIDRREAVERRTTTRPAVLAHGEELFFQHGCYSCHAIEGTDAKSTIGPDLTHLGNRRTLGAAAIPNNYGNLAGWIANPQTIKPGSLMPPTYLEPGDLHAVVEYLLSLE